MHPKRGWIGLALLLGVAGCGSSSATVAVEGQLQIAGQPADSISVQFVPDSASNHAGLKAAGFTDGTGRFTLRCEDGRGGAIPGRYHVLLDDLKVYANPRNNMPPEARAKLIVSRIPKAYRSAGSTPLKVVVEGKPQQVLLEVKP